MTADGLVVMTTNTLRQGADGRQDSLLMYTDYILLSFDMYNGVYMDKLVLCRCNPKKELIPADPKTNDFSFRAPKEGCRS